jgi:hypothetical protein
MFTPILANQSELIYNKIRVKRIYAIFTPVTSRTPQVKNYSAEYSGVRKNKSSPTRYNGGTYRTIKKLTLRSNEEVRTKVS